MCPNCGHAQADEELTELLDALAAKLAPELADGVAGVQIVIIPTGESIEERRWRSVKELMDLASPKLAVAEPGIGKAANVAEKILNEAQAILERDGVSAKSVDAAAHAFEQVARMLADAEAEAAKAKVESKPVDGNRPVRMRLHNNVVVEVPNANEFAKGIIGTPVTDADGNQNGHISNAAYVPGKGISVEITSVMGGVRRLHECLLYGEDRQG